MSEWAQTFISKREGERLLTHPSEIMQGIEARGIWKDLWCANVDRVIGGETAVFVRPPDYLYVVKFDFIAAAYGGLVKLYRNFHDKSGFTLVLMDRSIPLPEPSTKVFMVEPPTLVADKIEFRVTNMIGVPVGTYAFGKNQYVNTQRLRFAVINDMLDPLDCLTQVSFSHYYVLIAH
jgi:hypothetical protein